MSLIWSLDRVTQVVMDGLFHPFHFVGKKNSNPGHARKNCKVLRVVYTQGRRNCFKMEWVFLLFLYGTKSSENNGPNAQPGQCKTPSECYKNRYIRRYWPATNWILCLSFCCGSKVCHWWRFFYLQQTFWIFPGLVWLRWPKCGSHYYFFKIAR